MKETVTRALEKISLVKEKEALLEENKALIQDNERAASSATSLAEADECLLPDGRNRRAGAVDGPGHRRIGHWKELVARAIHDLSPRAEKPFVSVNCGAFTETLLESELFGYVKGSFTGANANRKGLFRSSQQRDDLPERDRRDVAGNAVKLLRVLQERKVRPVGATEETGGH